MLKKKNKKKQKKQMIADLKLLQYLDSVGYI